MPPLPTDRQTGGRAPADANVRVAVGARVFVHNRDAFEIALLIEFEDRRSRFRPVRDGLVAQGEAVAQAKLDVTVINSCHLITTFPTVVDGTPRHRGA